MGPVAFLGFVVEELRDMGTQALQAGHKPHSSLLRW